VFLTQRTIRLQQDAIGRLSVPILEVRERMLIAPIVGIVDSNRARDLTEQLRDAIASGRANIVVVDVTNADVDGVLAEHLLELSRAADSHGAHVIVAGMPADALEIAGVDLADLKTAPDLQSACDAAAG
jgi:rsbT co-antagonist protein RsbR